MTIISISDKVYPKLLAKIDKPPQKLYAEGDLKLLNQPAITVVGSRAMSSYGRTVTAFLVRDLVANNLVIVSGLARGVDAWAQQTCLNHGGKTIAVLAHGLDKIYPPENRVLAEEILEKGGLLLSEYPLKTAIKVNNFKARDRLMAGLTAGTLVIEGKSKSGTKITASYAADFGREVFAVPGPIDSPTAIGPAELIQQGAKLVLTVDDILEELRP
ncbi:MAG TPA: DNA-processing protein DprA [Patescibacteria group bacterium]|nr:DNA-processing protein DprA [Patescibacteria group bacterium]